MIRRRQPVKQARPFAVAIRVGAQWLTPKRPLAFATLRAAKVYADTVWRGVYVEVTDDRTGEKWPRANGEWRHMPAPAPKAPAPADQPRYYWQDRD